MAMQFNSTELEGKVKNYFHNFLNKYNLNHNFRSNIYTRGVIFIKEKPTFIYFN